MPPKKLLTFLLIVAVIFVAFGDSFTFLPPPARKASVQSRQFVIGLWPQWLRPRNTNEKRDQEVERLTK